jgi:hypothetical protein
MTSAAHHHRQETDVKIMGMLKADTASEGGVPPSKELIERMGTFVAEISQAGVMLATDGLHPSAKGKRVKLADGKFTVIDGPFTESKELIASYALFQVKTMDEAVHWTKRFLEVLGKGECELRPVLEAEDFSQKVFTPEERKKEAATRENMQRNAGR